jgi:hypothetical protein
MWISDDFRIRTIGAWLIPLNQDPLASAKFVLLTRRFAAVCQGLAVCFRKGFLEHPGCRAHACHQKSKYEKIYIYSDE